jgi:HD-GYP domain-containing protein (c-di-GMP phosphodiesterase class II)
MRLTPVTRATGLTLARDLPATGAARLPLLRAGTKLTERFAHALVQQGIHAVWVHDDLSDGIEPVELVPEPVRQQAASRVASALAEAREAFIGGVPLGGAVIEDLSEAVEQLTAAIISSPDAALALCDLAAADAYTHQHSIDVTALGLLLGRELMRRNGWRDYRGRLRFDRVEERLAKLGMGLLLHDIGKMSIPTEILDKPGELDEEEWALMRGHPDAGVALLASDSISPLVKSVVRDHHERWNGSGYPRGVPGSRIGEFARIAAVADVYDAMTSERPYKAAEPASVGVGVIVEGSGTQFDPAVVDVFRGLVFPYPIGTELALPDDRIGVVARVDPSQPEVPIVRVRSGDGWQEVPVDTRLAEAAPAA